MKKIMSIVLALMMLLSGFSVLTVSAEGGLSDILYSEETIAAAKSALSYFKVDNLPNRFDNFKTFKTSAEWSKVNLMGISLDFLYSGTGALYWSDLDVFQKDENGNLVYGADGFPVKLISEDDISEAFTNVNTYLQTVIYNKLGGLNMYTVENAVSLANIIGNIFYADFVDLDPVNFKYYFNNEVPSSNDFYKAAIKLSGLDKIIDANWIPRGKEYCEPVIKIICGNSITFYDDYYNDGLILGSKLLEAVIKKITSLGPIEFAYDIINAFTSSAYGVTYCDPMLALFTHKIPVIGNNISTSELNSFSGLLQLVFCNSDCYSTSPDGAVKFCPLDFPNERFNVTANKEEALIYLYYYLNLCGRYKNNNVYFRNIITSLRADTTFTDDDKSKLEALIDAFFLAESETSFKDAVIPLYKLNAESTSTSISVRMRNAFMTFLKKIADYFNYIRKILSGELQYGQGNSPFN